MAAALAAAAVGAACCPLAEVEREETAVADLAATVLRLAAADAALLATLILDSISVYLSTSLL